MIIMYRTPGRIVAVLLTENGVKADAAMTVKIRASESSREWSKRVFSHWKSMLNESEPNDAPGGICQSSSTRRNEPGDSTCPDCGVEMLPSCAGRVEVMETG
jgi:hypothetical protein